MTTPIFTNRSGVRRQCGRTDGFMCPCDAFEIQTCKHAITLGPAPMPANDIPQSLCSCEGTHSCLGCLIERTVQDRYGNEGLRFLRAALQSPPPREADAALWPLVEEWQTARRDLRAAERDEHGVEAAEKRYQNSARALEAYRPPSAPAPAMTAWQPIETAPKDGARVLLGSMPAGEHDGESTCGSWSDAEEDGPDVMGHDAGFWDIDYGVFQPSRSFGQESHRYEGRQPTHWQPLPSPPPPETQP